MDLLIVPCGFFFKWLSLKMLATNVPCNWTYFGLQCGTCGGTRCVKNFLSGNFSEAFKLNQLVFIGIIVIIITFILLNLAFFFNLSFAKKTLRIMYDYRVIIAVIIIFAIFTIVRNIPRIIEIIEIL